LSSQSDSAEILSFIGGFVDAVNRGDGATAIASLTPNVTIVEDLAPFRWHGPTAGAEWLGAMFENAQRLGIASVFMQLGRASRIEVEGAHAYAVVEGQLQYGGDGPPLRSDGILTFVLLREGDWSISVLVWSGPEATA
jgi:ketosteroid isomerase-like protein